MSVNFENIVRIKKADLDGDKRLDYALTRVKGVDHSLAKSIIHVLKLDCLTKLKDLDEKTIEKIEDLLDDPVKHGIPSFKVNRQKDYDTGKDKHITSSDLTLQLRTDVNRMRKIRAYKGIRHELGLTLRGQRTKSSFRKGSTMGVSRKKK
jgi:small subunit ribosomal protein S13